MGLGLDLFCLRKDGTEIPVDIMLSPVDTEGGMLVICALRDISERKQMEAELTEVQQQLIESVEAERSYLAQELHDGPIQDLYAISYQIQGMEVKEHDLDSLVSATEAMKQVISQLREICGDLRPPALAPFGLEKAILTHLEQLRDKNPNLQIEADLMPDGQLIPDRARLALYRVYQHAVSNVLRHAQASKLSVKFEIDPEEIVLEVEDDGCGFELPKRWVDFARLGHLGLVGTTERAEAVGGHLDIISSPGNGTIVRVTVPRDRQSPSASSKSLHRFRLI
jgi:signal transduction histidine kinase